jgi:hypothetical protein
MMTRLMQIESLRMKHNKLELDLAAEHERPRPDLIRISALKRQKLKVKDQMASLMAQRLWPPVV